jgi:hypothetical protein
MKKNAIVFLCAIVALHLDAQIQVDRPIELQGTSGNRKVSNLELPVAGTDAANKDYVDAAVAATGGGSTATMMSNESSSDLVLGQCIDYCKNLNEGGYTDWRLATVGDFIKLASSDSYTIPQNTSANFAMFLVDNNGGAQSAYFFHRYQFSAGTFINTTNHASGGRARCVR